MTNPPTPECREEFEAHMRREGFTDADLQWFDGVIHPNFDKGARIQLYPDSVVNDMWLGWQACWSRPVSAIDTADPEALARRFHEAYERLAPSFGYETRVCTRLFDPDLANGRLMTAVCRELLAAPLPSGATRETATE